MFHMEWLGFRLDVENVIVTLGICLMMDPRIKLDRDIVLIVQVLAFRKRSDLIRFSIYRAYLF